MLPLTGHTAGGRAARRRRLDEGDGAPSGKRRSTRTRVRAYPTRRRRLLPLRVPDLRLGRRSDSARHRHRRRRSSPPPAPPARRVIAGAARRVRLSSRHRERHDEHGGHRLTGGTDNSRTIRGAGARTAARPRARTFPFPAAATPSAAHRRGDRGSDGRRRRHLHQAEVPDRRRRRHRHGDRLGRVRADQQPRHRRLHHDPRGRVDRQEYQATVVGTAPTEDIAVLKLATRPDCRRATSATRIRSRSATP